MADTKWCPACGAEYVARVSTCADCGVALVDAPPAPERTDPVRTGGGGGPLEYDLTEWDDEARSSLEWMLRGRGITFEWDAPGILLVPEHEEAVVDGFVDYLAADPAELEPVEDVGPADLDVDIDEFYDADPRRRASEEVEYGVDWSDRDGVRYEVAWIEDTGELVLMTADGGLHVEVLGEWPERADVDALLDGWQSAMPAPHSVEWLRGTIERRLPSS